MEVLLKTGDVKDAVFGWLGAVDCVNVLRGLLAASGRRLGELGGSDLGLQVKAGDKVSNGSCRHMREKRPTIFCKLVSVSKGVQGLYWVISSARVVRWRKGPPGGGARQRQVVDMRP